MSFNGSGTFQPYVPGNPVVTGTVISSTAFNATINDIAAGLSNAVTRDGQSPLTANLPAAGRKITGLGAGVVAGDSLRFEQLFSQGTEQDIASAATVDIGGLNTTIARITGTTTITSFGTNYNGPRYVRFAGALLLTHNATTLILPGGANITTATGDRAILTPVGNPASGWQVLAYEIAALAPGAANTATTLSGTVAIANGGTGATTAATARTALGVDGTNFVTMTGNQTVAGVKTLSSAPILSAGATFGSATLANVATSAPLFGARAFGVFDGRTTGTFAPNNSGNVTSITRNSVGNYTVTMTAAMSTTDYVILAIGRNTSVATTTIVNNESNTTTSFVITTIQTGASFVDCAFVSFAVFRT